MPHPPRLFPSDVELGKRDDDHKPGSKSLLTVAWSHHRIFLRRSYKKIGVGIVILFGLYYFFKYMPTDLGPRTSRPNYDYISGVERQNRWSNSQNTKLNDAIQSGAGDRDETDAETEHWFNGPIKFYELAASLNAISQNTRGGGLTMRHVLFASSSVKSAAILLPLACEMANLKRSYVHFAFMGRDEISLDLLKEVNGVKDGCNVWFHDGRPDFLLQSSDYRMEVSSSAALGHIDNYMHPQAVIIDNSGLEEEFFMKAFRERASILGKTLIELPDDAEQSLRWITRLDSSSLKYWNKVSIDIIIHAQPAASGSLLRLLDSLSKAQYLDASPPRLTIELPHEVEEPSKTFLENYRWPPSDYALEANANQLNLRRRIPQPGLTPEENSIRFLESFWPVNPAMSHLLVLSPQVELSPLYFHYLKYVILEYKYSNKWAGEKKLMGISLDLPSTYLNDTTSFSPPTKAGKTSSDSDSDSAMSFLWQAPNGNAALYFGDKWIELHSFLSHSLVSQHKLPNPMRLNAKDVSKTYPSWLEEILKLARTRGYCMLYSTLADQVALATIHNELYRPPEEFSELGDDGPNAPSVGNVDFTADPEHHLSLQHTEKTLASTSLLNLLPSDGVLPSLMDMPLLSWEGEEMTRIEMEDSASEYSEVFRREIGGCSASDTHKSVVDNKADDLFCLGEAD